MATIKLSGGPADGEILSRHNQDTPPIIYVKESDGEAYTKHMLSETGIAYEFVEMLTENMALYRYKS